jgi:geranylgeranyl diphosphate synthase type II
MNPDPSQRFEQHLSGITFPESPASLYDPIRYTLALGGKRIRPQLAMLACGIFSGEMEPALPVATAVELLHNFTLIHDDIMDNAELRRGKPTVFKKWGCSEAILSGDALFNIAWRQLLQTAGHVSNETFQAMAKEFDRAVTVVCEGQAVDLELARLDSVSESQYIGMIYAKTASLLEASLVLGALAGGANPEELKKIGEAGKMAGIAFQIQDDLLDALPQTAAFGKQRGGDVKEGKKTLLWIHLMNKVGENASAAWLQKLSAAAQDASALNDILEAYERFGVFESVKLSADAYYFRAMEALCELPQNHYTAYLSSLFKQLLDRNA